MKMLAFNLFHLLQTSLAWCGHSQPICSCWGSQTVQTPGLWGCMLCPESLTLSKLGWVWTLLGCRGRGWREHSLS